MPVSKPRKKKPARPAGKANRSGNPARRAEQEAERQEQLVTSAWREFANPFGEISEYRRQLDRQRMNLAMLDAQPIIKDLIVKDEPVSWIEDELCRRLGRALAEQDQASDDRRAAGAEEILDTYSPDQLIDAVTDASTLAALEDLATVGEALQTQQGTARRRLLMALARIVPHPAAEILIKTVKDPRERVPSLPLGSIDTAPTGAALWCRDGYGTRFAITAPFTPADGDPRWYLWDIDACGGDAYTVGGGYFAGPESALASWRAAVGAEATADSRLEPVADPHLAARLLPGLPDFFHPGDESEAQYAEFHRSRRLAQDLRASDFLNGSGTPDPAVMEPHLDKDAWIGEFASWRAEHRPGETVLLDDFPVGEDEEPLTEEAIYLELADSWYLSEFPEFAYTCSPHRIDLLIERVRDFYQDDFAAVLLRLLPDLADWLIQRAMLPAVLAARVRSRANAGTSLDKDNVSRNGSPLASVQE